LNPVGAITHTVDVSGSTETVFWMLLELAREGGLDSSFEYWSPRQWPPAVGTHNDFKAKVGPLAMKGVSRFAEFDPPRRLLIESVKPAWPLFTLMSWDLEPIESGTRYSYRMEVSAAPGAGWAGRLMLSVYDRKLAVDVPHLASLL
jgi:hypothetical protein